MATPAAGEEVKDGQQPVLKATTTASVFIIDKAKVEEFIREKALRLLNKEVPHGIAVEIEKMKIRDDGIYDIEASIYCERKSHESIIIGKGGAKLKDIGSRARVDIERFLDSKVYLKLWVKVNEDWRNKERFLNMIGFD